MPYNWHDELLSLILAVLLTRSVVLKVMARAGTGRVKTRLNRFSELLGLERFAVEQAHARYVSAALKAIDRRDLLLHCGRVVMIVDITEYAKPRSRGKKHAMPQTGKVVLHNVPSDEKILVAGYQEIWASLLLNDGGCLGFYRRLFSEKASFFSSQNLLTDAAIRDARDLVEKILGLEVILVVDRGFARKELLDGLRGDETEDFIIRLQGNWLIETAGGRKGSIEELSKAFVERLRMHWRENSKKPLYCAVRAFPARMRHEGRVFNVNILRLDSLSDDREPIFLATSLSIASADKTVQAVRLYSKRWAIETFFFQFKQSLGAGGFRVFGSWRVIDRLLMIAHMAMLALQLLYLKARRSKRDCWESAIEMLAWRSLRPTAMKISQFLEALALDFLQRREAWSPL